MGQATVLRTVEAGGVSPACGTDDAATVWRIVAGLGSVALIKAGHWCVRSAQFGPSGGPDVASAFRCFNVAAY